MIPGEPVKVAFCRIVGVHSATKDGTGERVAVLVLRDGSGDRTIAVPAEDLGTAVAMMLAGPTQPVEPAPLKVFKPELIVPFPGRN